MDGEVVGSVHPVLWPQLAAHWPLHGGATEALARLARHLRAHGQAGTWRDELVTVRSPSGLELTSVERGVVRVLGIRTQAVHLVGFAPDGRVWLQQRAFDKADDPGRWDTLVGGLMAHGEPIADTLQRETWEEAGLQLHTLVDLRRGGTFEVTKPGTDGGGMGHVWETIHWFTAVLPVGMTPFNQDGEVERFEALVPDAVRDRILAGECTDEAAWILAQALGWWLPLNDW